MAKARKRKDEAERRPGGWNRLGAGLVTGAADDDPSGIATYTQAGAKYGFDLLWTTFFTLPLMIGIQLLSARTARVTGRGLGANIKAVMPNWLAYGLMLLLLGANTINLAADLGAMGAALKLVLGGPALAWTAGCALLSLGLMAALPFERYAPVLKFLTASLLAYVGVMLVVDVPWREVLHAVLLPHVRLSENYLVAVVAVLGTTISPYLFFWQASHEQEEQREIAERQPLKDAPAQAPRAFARIRFDTVSGMLFSNAVAFFVMLTAGVVLHAHGGAVETTAQAAEALRPIAGDLAFALFALGIVGTGLLAVPILSASAAYALSDVFRWKTGLSKQPGQARMFYGVIAFATLGGLAMNVADIDPIAALYWAAVVNGVIAVPIMVAILRVAASRKLMGEFVAPRGLRIAGWAATVVMAVAVGAMFWSLG